MSPARRRSGWETPACIDEPAFYRRSKSLALTSLSILASVKPRLISLQSRSSLKNCKVTVSTFRLAPNLEESPRRGAGQPAARGLRQFCRPGAKAHDGRPAKATAP